LRDPSLLRSFWVFCGSSPGNDSAYAAGAVRLGRSLAQDGITLVYGGGRGGLMGVIADAVLGVGV
jgi:predicted Rossmann-fold nucleotide-binding protein